MGSPSQFAHLVNFTAGLRKPGLISFGLFNPQDAAWLDVIYPMPGGGGGGGSLDTFATVPYAASLVIDVSAASIIQTTLTGNVSSSVLNFGGGIPPTGQIVELRISQNGVGGWTFAFPSDLVLDAGFVVDPGPNRTTIFWIVWDGMEWIMKALAYSSPSP